jgi:hypothetical protein
MEFWLASGKEAVKTIARAKLAFVDLHTFFIHCCLFVGFLSLDFSYICLFSFVS